MSETQKHTKPNVPNLRFPGFEREWERIKVADLLEFFPTNSLSWDQLEYDGDSLLNLHYGLIHNGLPTQVNLNESELPSIKDDYKPKKYTLCEKGDIAFADASEDTNDVGKVIEFVDCAGKQIVCGLHTIHGRDKLHKTIPGFKGYAFSSKAFHDQIKRIAQGTKIFSISTGNFEEVSISIPGKAEQGKIASLLSIIDQRIAIQNKIIEDLKQLKTAISRRILWGNPLLTKRVPLGLLGELKNGYAFKSTTYIPNTKYNIITIANVSGERVINVRDCNTIPVLPKDLQQHQLLRPNDILISLTGNVGRVSLCCNNNNCLLNQRVGLFIPNDPKLHEYLFQVLSDERFLHSMIDAGQGAAQMNIGKGDIESFPIPFVDNPFILNRIAVVLNSLDLRIIMAKRKLLLLRKQRIHLMNALFI